MTRLLLNQKESAQAMGICVNTFKKEVRPFVRSVTLGSKLLFPVDDLQKWVDTRARGL